MARTGNNTHRYEFGRATVFIHQGPAILDGLIRTKFQAQIHPVGGPVMETEVQAFYPWDAANRALAAWEAARLEGLA